MTALCIGSTIQTYSAINQSLVAGTYTLISGILNQSLKIKNFNVNCSPGNITLQDSQGAYIAGPFNGGSSNTPVTLTTSADLQAVISDDSTLTVTIDAYFNLLPRTQLSANRQLNSAFQVSAFQDAFVHYSIDIAATLNLVTGQMGTVFLEISSTQDFQQVQELGRIVNGNAGTLSIGLNLTQTLDPPLSGYVPAGYYVRLRTLNNTGIPAFTFRSGQEILL